jgi:hypothetical protein
VQERIAMYKALRVVVKNFKAIALLLLHCRALVSSHNTQQV